MKKNRMMRLASVLLVCVLLTTSIISGTFAKYTTSTSASDSARIAKWGIGAPADLSFKLFDLKAFDNGKVASSDTTNVLAPGTSHEQPINLFTITGAAPEVMYNYTVALTVNAENSTTIAKLDSLAGFKWTLTKPGTTATKQEFATFAELKAAVDGLSQTNIAPNTLPTGYATGTNTMVIGWAWEFDDPANNAADTAAGDAAAAGTLDTFTLTLSITAEQVD